MYIHCLTKLIMYDEFENNFLQYSGYSNDPSSDEYYKNIREKMFFQELKNSFIYEYSEIRIGKAAIPGDKYANFYFLLFRNNVMVGKFELGDQIMKIRSIETTEGNDKIINILIDKEAINSPFFYWPNNKKYQNTIKEIQIRCVKAFKKGEKYIPPEIQNQFKEYASKINELYLTLLNDDGRKSNDIQEKAFKIIGTLKIADEGSNKVVGQKIRDMCDAIEVLCNSNKTIENARFNYPIQIQVDFAFFKRIKKNRKPTEQSKRIDDKLISPFYYDERTDATRDFSTVATLHYEEANISTINLRWFNAPALTWLTFKNCRLFEIPNAWEIFEANICKLKNLHTLKISDCPYLTEIPGTLFSKLPTSVDSLIFDGNSLTEISSEISNVKKLRYLNLERNLNLSNVGVPWESLPESLEIIFVKHTFVTKLPALKLERLKNLKRIDFPVYQLEEINVNEYVEKFNGLSLDIKKPIIRSSADRSCNNCIKRIQAGGHTTFVIESKKKYELTLNHRELVTYSWETLSETLTDLNLNQNKLTNIGSMKHLKNLRALSLSSNQISEINGEFLPESLKIIDFSDNRLTDAIFLRYLKNLKEVFLSFNQIETILWENLPVTLENINLGRNKLTFIGSMKHLKNLSNLSFHENEIASILWEDLPEGIKEITISKNKIGHVPSLKHLKNLTTLSLEENQIISIQWECLPESLKELVIFDNFITHMGSIKHLQNLVWLNAHTNRLETIEWESLPESLPSIIFRNNCLTNVGSIKHLKKLYELDLNENQISSILWEDFPVTLQTEINLSQNFLTGIGLMSHLKNVKTLKLNHNRIDSIQWEFLPPNLKDLNLSHNHISVLNGSTKFLPKLQNLNLAFNHLKKISAEILTFSNLETLNLCNNLITEITPAPLNLHNFMLEELDLSNNKFNNATENLTEKLWNNLPICEWLILGGNNLVELPCVLEGKSKNLNAVNCNLEYICPKLTNYIININIGNNPKLLFPFHPRHLLPCKYPKDNYEFVNINEHPYIIGDFKISSNTKKFKSKKNKFLPVSSEIDQSKFNCKCCATCIKKDASIKMVENDMVMDFLFQDYKTVENEKYEADMENRVYFDWDVFNRDRNTIQLPSQWKTIVRTRVCEECQNFTTMLIEGVNSKKLDISNEENNPAKKIRIEQPMESVTEKNSPVSGENRAMDDEIIDFEFSAFPQKQSSLPAQTYYYEEPHGCSSKAVPLTKSTPFPQQQQQQPREQYYYDDLINPVGYQNDFSYQIPTNSQPENNVDRSMIERIVIQDSFGNHLMTAPASSIISEQSNQPCQIPQTFDNLQNGNNQLTSTNIFLPQQHHYFAHSEMPQFVDHQQQWRHNLTNFEHLQNINHLHDDINNTYIEPHFLYHPENHESQQNSSNNYNNFFVDKNSSGFLNDINKL